MKQSLHLELFDGEATVFHVRNRKIDPVLGYSYYVGIILFKISGSLCKFYSYNMLFTEVSFVGSFRLALQKSYSILQSYCSLRPATLLKKRLWRRCFSVSFAKFLRTPFLIEHLRWLLLSINRNDKHSNKNNNGNGKINK